MFDLKVLELKEKMINAINESGLPASILSYIVKDISVMVDKTLSEQIRAQLSQQAQAKQEQEQVQVDNVEEN